MWLLRRYCFVFVLLMLSSAIHAQQREANTWYFGRFLGLDFNSGAAVPINNGQLNTTEGVATISDASGALLFYTDGITIWNKQHQVMPNGTGLFGNVSSTQSAVIVQKIGDPQRYYVFTVDAQGGPRGLAYSIVNMTLAGGNGDVELKNVPMQSNVVEKVTAVKHCNNRDVWVIAHGTRSNIYYAFLVTATGVSATPVISTTGATLPGAIPPSSTDSSSLGYLKASPDGKRIAAAHFTVSADVSDFDNATGVISNTFNLFLPTERHYYAYGIEFSPNSQLVYTSVFYTDPVNAQSRNALLQYDVSLPTPAAVQASKQVIATNSDPVQTFAALQVAPDGKMYMAKNLYKHIAAIDNPNTYGTGCNFVTNAIQFSLANQASSFGLPTFVQSYFYPPDSFNYAVDCPGATFRFSYVQKTGTSSVLWNFGDPASGGNNTSAQLNPVHQFSAPGTYTVQLVKFTNCGNDTLRRTITADTLNIQLGRDTVVCGATQLLLNSTALGSANTFLWQDGSSQPTFTATAPGLYWVEVKNNAGCTKRDSIVVDFKPVPVFNLGADTDICDGVPLLLNAAAANANSYLWSTAATTPSIQATQTGLYWCEATRDGCSYRDSLVITAIKPSPVISLGADQTVCEGTSIVLDATYLTSTYLWQDGSTNSSLTAVAPGSYWVQLDYNGCKKSDTVRIVHNLKPSFSLGYDQLICNGNTITLRPPVDASWQLLWQDGSSSPTYVVSQPGLYSLMATNHCGSFTDDVVFTKGVCKVYIPTAFTPNNDGKNDLFKVLGAEAVTSFHFRLYNRWGQVVFETTDPARGWDGRFRGVTQSGDVYVYTLNYTAPDEPGQQFRKGTFLLIR